MKDNRYELAERHGMSKEFIDWFFDNKKSDCGNLWFMTMAVMWEGWKASREQLVVELPDVLDDKYSGSAPCMDDFNPDLYMTDLTTTLKTAGITVKSD